MDRSLDLETVRAFIAIARLGARLMERATRLVALTLAGARFLPFAEQLLEADRAARHAASGLAAQAETVSIGAPDEVSWARCSLY